MIVVTFSQKYGQMCAPYAHKNKMAVLHGLFKGTVIYLMLLSLVYLNISGYILNE